MRIFARINEGLSLYGILPISGLAYLVMGHSEAIYNLTINLFTLFHRLFIK